MAGIDSGEANFPGGRRTVGRIALGLLGPLFGEVNVGAASSGLIAVSLIGSDLAGGLWTFFALLFVFGAAYGSPNALIGPLVTKICSPTAVGQAVGALATSQAIGVVPRPLARRTGLHMARSLHAPIRGMQHPGGMLVLPDAYIAQPDREPVPVCCFSGMIGR